MSKADSLYVSDELKERLKTLKPESQTLSGFINTLADVWQGLTDQERVTAILACKQNQNEGA